ncbi:hypothetical protein CK203_109590 [Vitis vinifera]|uniref:MADS-box domain-containing protein n=1 Tax=Vitis vinifera TaxID=29760 RepID=A0A438FGS3_VITVI|nr:hypothetical protein CK203_109590 [Vitis vinifera]
MEKKRAKSHEKVEMRRMNNEEDRLVSFSKHRSGIYRSWYFSFLPKWEPFSFGHPCIKRRANLIQKLHKHVHSKSRSYRPWNHVQLYHLIPKQLAMAMEEGHAK